MKKTRVLITGAGGPAGMGSIKSLKEDTSIETVAADMNSYAAGLYWTEHRVIVPSVGSKNYIDKMLETIKQQKIDVLFPTVDEEMEPIAENIDKFQKMTRLCISPLKSIKRCIDKWTTYHTLKRYNIPVVKTIKIGDEHNLNEAEETMGFPLAIKPMVSRGGRGLYYCKDQAELKNNYYRLKKSLPFSDTYYDPGLSKTIICQEYLPGTEYDVVALRNKDGSLIANVPLKAKEWDVKNQRRTIVTEHNETAMSLAEDTLHKLGLVGPIDIEMKEDIDGKMKILDINPRVGGDIELAAVAGCNIPLLTVKLAQGKKVQYTDFKDDFVLIRYIGIQTMKRCDIPVRN